jgi:hypothetical protein
MMQDVMHAATHISNKNYEKQTTRFKEGKENVQVDLVTGVPIPSSKI